MKLLGEAGLPEPDMEVDLIPEPDKEGAFVRL